MGTASAGCISFFPYLGLDASNWIDLIAIIVNALLAYWIVKTIQNRLQNKRVLKDHFINEIKEIRNEYKTCLSNLYSDNTIPSRVIPWFKLMNIRVTDIMTHINEKYGVDKDKLKPYQRELQELITNNSDFMAQFRSTTAIKFSENSKTQMIVFQQSNNKLFNDIIVAINDSEK